MHFYAVITLKNHNFGMEIGVMRILYFKLLILLALTVLVSCEEDYLLERETFRPSVVVNSIFKNGKSWVVNLTFSKDILTNGSEIIPITNASVSIIEKSTGREIVLYHTQKGNYQSDIYPPQADKIYELLVDVPGYKTVKAVSSAPKKANVVNIITDIVDDKTTKIDFEIKDNISNYYIWNFISTNPKNPLDTTFTGNPKDLVKSIKKYNDISGYLNSLSSSNDNDAISQGGLFSTNIKNSQQESTAGNGSSTSGETQTNKRYLRLLTASKDLYNYYKTVEKFILAENHNSSFSHSPEIYSNISNGLGIFAGFTEEFKEIK